MDKHISNKRGFTLVEMLIVCFAVVMIMLTLAVPITAMNLFRHWEHYDFQYCQLEAMATQNRCAVSKSVWFNHNGNINQAQTVIIGNKKCVFQLGFGRFKCEQQ